MPDPDPLPPLRQRAQLALIDFAISSVALIGLIAMVWMLAPMGEPWAATWAVGRWAHR